MRQREHDEWSKKTAPLLSVVMGLLFSFLVGGVLGAIESAPSWDSAEFWLLVLGSAGISGLSTHFIMDRLISRSFARHAELAQVANQLEFFRRANDKLGAFLFFVNGTSLESALGWFKESQSRSLNMVIARAIQEQLDRSFEPTGIVMPINAYADFSAVTDAFLEVARDVCFTCILSPKNWFLSVAKPSVSHVRLPRGLQPPAGQPDYDPNSLVGLDQLYWEKYPAHFVSFLETPGEGVQRRRVFLLDEDEWKDMLDPANKAFFDKFMGPCRRAAALDTRFVRLPSLETAASIRAPTREKQVLTAAIAQKITDQDYEVFEGQALLVYTEPAGAGSPEALEFKVGSTVKAYADFIECLFSLDQEYGVHTYDEVSLLISSPPAAPAASPPAAAGSPPAPPP